MMERVKVDDMLAPIQTGIWWEGEHVPVLEPATADSYAGGFSAGTGAPDCIWKYMEGEVDLPMR